MCESESSALEYAGFLKETVNCKKAAVVLGFFTYLMYLGVTGLIHFL